MTNPYPMLLSCVDEDRRVAFLTIVESSRPQSYKVGEKYAVSESGEILLGESISDEFSRIVRELGGELLKEGRARSQSFEVEGAQVVLYGEPVTAEPRLILFGGGHVSKSIAEVASVAGFKIMVVENRAEFADIARFPVGTEFRVDEWEEVIPTLSFHSNTYIVIVTRAHAYDELILKRVIDQKWKYLAMIGSKKKVRKIFSHLVQQGISERQIAQVHAPIGFDIGAQSPGEIAVSVVAEMIAVKYGKRGVEREKILPDAGEGKENG